MELHDTLLAPRILRWRRVSPFSALCGLHAVLTAVRTCCTRYPAGATGLSVMQTIQTGSGAHKTSCSVTTWRSVPGSKAAGT